MHIGADLTRADVNAMDDDNTTPMHLATEADEAIMAINAVKEMQK